MNARVVCIAGWTLAALAACGPTDRTSGGDPWTTFAGWEEHAEESFQIVGTVRERDLEGGIWVIRAPDGEEWAPLGIPEDFRVDGAGVVADVRTRPDLMSFAMVGEIVEILRIRHGSVPAGSEGEVPADVLPPASGEAPSALLGEWRIVEAHLPGISTGRAAAERWIGRSVEYGRTFSFGPNGECTSATFDARRSGVDALLSGRYGIPSESLPPVAEAESVVVVEVHCDGAFWNGLGATVLLLDDGRALTPWDGAFLVLERVS